MTLTVLVSRIITTLKRLCAGFYGRRSCRRQPSAQFIDIAHINIIIAKRGQVQALTVIEAASKLSP